MAEFLNITVHPSVQEGENLTVQDAMQQVLDIIELLDRAGSVGGSGGARVVWRLKSATTNSPFTVRAEGTSSDPTVSIAIKAAQAKTVLAQSFSELGVAKVRPAWMDNTTLRMAKRVLDRNLKTVGQTDIDTERDAERILIFPTFSQAGSKTIDLALIDSKYDTPDQTHTEFGSAEGSVIAAATYYNHPAIFLRERLTGDRVTCVLSDDAAEKVGNKQNLNVVWDGQRILVKGALHYGRDGRIIKIDAEDFELIEEQYVDINEIRAMNITNGLSPNAYLDKLREEDFGDT